MKILDIPRSGSYQAITSSRNRGGQYVRNRRSPVQPVGTGRRAFIRGAFGASSSGWAGLTDAERAAWEGYASGVPYTDRLGQQIYLTGHQMYVAITTQLLNCGAAASASPPVSTAVYDPTPVSFTADVVTGLSVNWTAGATNEYMLLAYSPQMSPGRSYNGTWWQAVAAAGDDNPQADTVAYVAQFGALVATKKIFCKATPVNQYGVAGASVIVSAIVTP